MAPLLSVLQAPPRLLGQGLGALGGLLLGADRGEWDDPEQELAARRAALGQAGLSMVQAAGGPTSFGRFGPSPLASVAAGLQAGREMYGEAAQAASERSRRAAAYEGIGASGRFTRDDMMQVFLSAVRSGDADTARAASEMLKSGAFGEGARMQFIEGADAIYALDPQTGQVVNRVPVQSKAAAGARQLREVYDPETQTRRFAWISPTGEQSFVEGVAPPQNLTEAQSKAAAFSVLLQPLEQSGRLNAITQREVPSVITQYLNGADNPAAFALIRDENTRQLLYDAAVYAEAFLRITTGAAYNAQEFRNAMRQYTPLPGDSPMNLEEKRSRRATLMRALAVLGGVGGSADAQNAHQFLSQEFQRQNGYAPGAGPAPQSSRGRDVPRNAQGRFTLPLNPR